MSRGFVWERNGTVAEASKTVIPSRIHVLLLLVSLFTFVM